MKDESKLSRLVLVSPWVLLVFLVIPILVILSLKFNLRLPLLGPGLLLANNVCFAVLSFCRLIRYIYCMGKGVRYGSSLAKPRGKTEVGLSASQARGVLENSGFSFTVDGLYGEKREIGFLGTALLYGGLTILLATGSWDNLRQFSGVILDGMGPATDLNKIGSYRSVKKGPVAKMPVSLPSMQILNQYLPDASYPMGGTEIALYSEDGKVAKTILKPRDPYKLGAYDIYMSRLVYEAEIVIRSKAAGVTLFDSIVRLEPLVQKRGAFSFYGLFQGDILGGGVYYQPEKSLLMAVISRGDKKVVTDLVFQVDQQVEQGDYILSCAKMGQWSEIHVVHRRHKGLLWLGGIVALLGLALRIAVRPQRVWLEESSGGCVVRTVGTEAERLLSEGQNR